MFVNRYLRYTAEYLEPFRAKLEAGSREAGWSPGVAEWGWGILQYLKIDTFTLTSTIIHLSDGPYVHSLLFDFNLLATATSPHDGNGVITPR